ncbi:MAG: prolipoprotein diacylglyceryl transferase [Clostridiales bacterium]|nr:prolipoprotein diacylglyceryl transferase [Clostridiales bacterium]
MSAVTFPGLGLSFQMDRVAFTVFGHPVYWYGIIIACGFSLAVHYCWRRAPAFGVIPDHILDMLLFAVPLSIAGARLYYVLFYLDLYRRPDGSLNFARMVRVWDGGLAIYGAVIAGVLTVFIFTKIRKLSFAAWADMGCLGLLIGQAVGRWGNFVNGEAYGGPTALPWRMGVYRLAGGTLQLLEVHPTFLYESLWNTAGFCVLAFLSRGGRRKFDGMLFTCYIAWYGFGRGLIEGMRSDSLYLFQTGIRISQLLGFASSALAVAFLIYHLAVRKHTPEELYVNRINKEVELYGNHS